jgi:hypothetical protein
LIYQLCKSLKVAEHSGSTVLSSKGKLRRKNGATRACRAFNAD